MDPAPVGGAGPLLGDPVMTTTRTRPVPARRIETPRTTRGRGRSPHFPTRPFYTVPVFYVGIVATLVCGYFAVHFG